MLTTNKMPTDDPCKGKKNENAMQKMNKAYNDVNGKYARVSPQKITKPPVSVNQETLMQHNMD